MIGFYVTNISFITCQNLFNKDQQMLLKTATFAGSILGTKNAAVIKFPASWCVQFRMGDGIEAYLKLYLYDDENLKCAIFIFKI